MLLPGAFLHAGNAVNAYIDIRALLRYNLINTSFYDIRGDNMQDNDMELGGAEDSSEEDEQLRKKREAEERVAKMFANAKTQSKRPKKKSSSMTYSDVPIASRPAVRKEAVKAETEEPLGETIHESVAPSAETPTISDKQEKLREAEEKVAKMFAESSTSGKRDMKSLCSLPPAETAEQQEKNKTAEDKLAEIFAAAEAQKNSSKKGRFGSLVTEILILEVVSLFLFFITMNKEAPSFFSLFTVLLPVIVGIGYRVLKQQLTLLEAISRCKLHIAATVFFFLCIIFSV